jgi:hypothetical protein
MADELEDQPAPTEETSETLSAIALASMERFIAAYLALSNVGNQPSDRRAPPPPSTSGRMMGRKTEIP